MCHKEMELLQQFLCLAEKLDQLSDMFSQLVDCDELDETFNILTVQRQKLRRRYDELCFARRVTLSRQQTHAVIMSRLMHDSTRTSTYKVALYCDPALP